jgi:hypothetical protein
MHRRGFTRRTGIALAVGLMAAVPAAAGTASAATPGAAARVAHPRTPAAIDYYPLQEKVLSATYDDEPPTGYSVGDGGTWHNQLIDAHGTVIADVTGTSKALYEDSSGLYEVMDNTDVLKDGTVHSAGLVNNNDLTDGKTVTLPAVGVSGRYKGYVGIRTFQRTSTDNVYLSRLELWKVQ